MTNNPKLNLASECKKPRHSRDDFKANVVKKLREMAGGLCSKPDCRIVTNGANEAGSDTVNVGVAAHICAAAPGGPRYDPTMTPEQRRSYENGIWLCQIHAKLVDSDPNGHSVALLQSWKREAEDYSKSRVGQQSLTKNEHQLTVQKAASTAIADFVNNTNQSQIPIGVLAQRYSQSLNEIDPRVDVQVRIDERGSVNHLLTAKPGQTVVLNLLFRSIPTHPNPGASLKRLFESGEKATFEAGQVEIQGSKLFEKFNSLQNAQLTMYSRSKKADAYLIASGSGEKEFIATEFKVEITNGTKELQIKGNIWRGLLRILAKFSLPNGRCTYNLSIDFNVWLEQQLDKLSYFYNLNKLHSFIISNKNITLPIDFILQEIPIRLGNNSYQEYEELIDTFVWYFELVKSARKIAEFLPERLLVKSFKISEQESNLVNNYVGFLTGESIRQVACGHVLCEGVLSENGNELMSGARCGQRLSAAKYVENEAAILNVLGNKVQAPKVTVGIAHCDIVYFCRLEDRETEQVSFQIIAVEETILTTYLDPEDSWQVIG